MKKKFKNKKAISLAVACLAAVSVATVGFSSWIIGGANTATETVSVTVGDVTDRRITLAIHETHDSKDLSVAFDCGQAVTGNPIQPATGTAGDEDMQFTIVFTMYANDSSAFSYENGFAGVTLTFATSNLYALTNGNVIVSPFTVAENGSSSVKLFETSLTGSGQSGSGTFVGIGGTGTKADPYTCTVEFNFTWGTAVKKKNPTKITSTEIDEGVYTAMNLLDKANDSGVSIGITVSI